MIRTESMEFGGKQFTRTYSDSGRYVVRDGVSYDEAIDPTELGRTYEEGNHITYDEQPSDDASEVLDILLGGTDD